MTKLIGKKAPLFSMKAVLPSGQFGTVSLEEQKRKQRWTVLLFYPANFADTTPAELTVFSDRYEEFQELKTDIIAVSGDTIYAHFAWLQMFRSKGGLEGLRFSLAQDRTHQVSRAYEVMDEVLGLPIPSTFIIDPSGNLVYSAVSDVSYSRNVEELLRILYVHILKHKRDHR